MSRDSQNKYFFIKDVSKLVEFRIDLENDKLMFERIINHDQFSLKKLQQHNYQNLNLYVRSIENQKPDILMSNFDLLIKENFSDVNSCITRPNILEGEVIFFINF